MLNTKQLEFLKSVQWFKRYSSLKGVKMGSEMEKWITETKRKMHLGKWSLEFKIKPGYVLGFLLINPERQERVKQNFAF